MLNLIDSDTQLDRIGSENQKQTLETLGCYLFSFLGGTNIGIGIGILVKEWGAPPVIRRSIWTGGLIFYTGYFLSKMYFKIDRSEPLTFRSIRQTFRATLLTELDNLLVVTGIIAGMSISEPILRLVQKDFSPLEVPPTPTPDPYAPNPPINA